MESVTRTIYSSHLSTAKLLGKPFSVLPNSTLNQKFNLFQLEIPNVNEYPVLKYIAIGNKGASYEVANNGYILTSPIPHSPRNASLYNFIPFVLREIYNDLNSTERLKYRMRVPVVINGVQYVAYYLKSLDTDFTVPSVELRNINNGKITTSAYIPNLSDLSPAPVELSNTNINNPNGDYLVSTAKLDFILNEADISEILNACHILYGDSRYSVINEIALVTGIDRILQGNFGNSINNYTEVISAQIAAFISQYHSLTTNSTEVRIQFDLGSVEPLLV
jgi:hypothetical protein